MAESDPISDIGREICCDAQRGIGPMIRVQSEIRAFALTLALVYLWRIINAMMFFRIVSKAWEGIS
jgi:hypothetical protein